uniref:Endonuclease/exonuclease/phosphatase domain-containing protein n=1 Tax=Anopheles atroparvus TaxID=41427 RepID=A0A182IWY8_ANOAO
MCCVSGLPKIPGGHGNSTASRGKLLLFGDFNTPSVDWSADPVAPSYFVPTDFGPRDAAFVDGVHLNGLMQLSGIVNARGRQLDLVFGNPSVALYCGTIVPAPAPLVPEDSHHPALEFNSPDQPA